MTIILRAFFPVLLLAVASGPAPAAELMLRPGIDPLVKMPGDSFQGPLAAPTPEEEKLAATLRANVETLAGLGEKSVSRYPQLVEAAVWIEKELAATGYQVERQEYSVRGRACWNVIVEIPGSSRAAEIVVIGAHYDTSAGAPGANDNGSGVASGLALARLLREAKPERTLRFVFFPNEEQPYFQTDLMGSAVYARRCYERREKIAAMLSLETLGYYTDSPGTQNYPAELARYYPTTGNFLALVGDVRSGPLVIAATQAFRRGAQFPVEGAAIPAHLPGVGWSDHACFWRYGYPAIMATDTAFYRYPHYHRATDTADKLDYARLARVIVGLQQVATELCTPAAGTWASALDVPEAAAPAVTTASNTSEDNSSPRRWRNRRR